MRWGISTFLALTMSASLLLAAPAAAITNGELDGDAHPQVVLLIMDVEGSPAYRCSGALISPTTVLTAGHCTGEPGEFTGIRAFLEADVENGDNNYPFPGPNTVEASAWYSHPEFTGAQFYLHDVGVVILSEPVELDAYASLPELDEIEGIRRGRKGPFTAVGYGLQAINPVFVESQRIRMVATPHLVMKNVPGFTGPFSIMLSNNHSTGGTCFGDSGGPNFIGDSLVVGGVTSFGINDCNGIGGVFRVDRADVLDFVNSVAE